MPPTVGLAGPQVITHRSMSITLMAKRISFVLINW